MLDYNIKNETKEIKMFKDIVAITKEKHAGKKVKELSDFNFASQLNIASVMVHEFSKAASIYPIVFIEDKENDKFRAVALLGLDSGENLFVKDGKWQASYIPSIIRRYPFALAKTEQDDRYTICIDESSGLINDDEGQELLDKDGNSSELIEKVKKYLGELQQMDFFTEDFVQFLKENNMFTPLNMKVKYNQEIKSINGAYVVNEERLNSLSDEKYLEFKNKHYIAAIYSHLSSLSQIERLLGFKDENTIQQEIEKPDEDRFEEKKKK
jgi:hypothetical protein